MSDHPNPSISSPNSRTQHQSVHSNHPIHDPLVEATDRGMPVPVPELRSVLQRLHLTEYHDVLVENGFHTWDIVLDITEDDLTALNFKLGHRRALQREIASFRGVPRERELSLEKSGTKMKSSPGRGGEEPERVSDAASDLPPGFTEEDMEAAQILVDMSRGVKYPRAQADDPQEDDSRLGAHESAREQGHLQVETGAEQDDDMSEAPPTTVESTDVSKDDDMMVDSPNVDKGIIAHNAKASNAPNNALTKSPPPHSNALPAPGHTPTPDSPSITGDDSPSPRPIRLWKRWTPEEEDQVTKYREEGLTFKEIADRMPERKLKNIEEHRNKMIREGAPLTKFEQEAKRARGLSTSNVLGPNLDGARVERSVGGKAKKAEKEDIEFQWTQEQDNRLISLWHRKKVNWIAAAVKDNRIPTGIQAVLRARIFKLKTERGKSYMKIVHGIDVAERD